MPGRRSGAHERSHQQAELLIRAEQLSRSFGDLLAVDRLDLELARGEVLGFLGPNGAGKTTTVRLLAALISPTSGTAIVNGHDVRNDADSVRRSVGILTETPGFYDRLSVQRNLEIFAALYDVNDPAARVARYLDRLGLTSRRMDPAGTLSKGMKQKLAICRALLHEPPIVFLDEPTSALDPEAARVVRDFIRELQSDGRTILLCTHNLEEADQLCDRVALFRTRLLVVETPDRLRSRLYGREIIFRVRSATDAYAEIIRGLPFATDEFRAGVIRRGDDIQVSSTDPERHNPGIIRALTEAGADILFVTEVRHSLEKIYLEVLAEKVP
ncbi:MAG: ABC transporter ATP-binding protein [Candidatus Hydrogenedentota bacterium]